MGDALDDHRTENPVDLAVPPDDLSGGDVFGRPDVDATGPTLGVLLPIFGLRDGTLHPERIAEFARYAEAHDLDGIWLADHLVHPVPLLDSIITLEHVATVTDQIRVGTAVLLLALRKAIVAAKQLATIASYHPGRLTVGVGVGGEHPLEFQASQVPLHERGRRLEDAVAEVRALWSGGRLDAPRHDHLRDVQIAPRPPRIPLLFGGHTPVALRRAARLGDAWVGFHKDEAQFADAVAILRAERARIDRTTMPTGMVLPTLVTDRNEGAAERAAAFIGGASTKDFHSAPDRFVLAGTSTH